MLCAARTVGASAHPCPPDCGESAQAFADREPEVLVVGGGHNGAVIAAQLEHLGVDTLLIERLPRIGDVRRNRYHPLALHMLTETSHFPLLPFPDYLSKDQFGDWIESYAKTLESGRLLSTVMGRNRCCVPATSSWQPASSAISRTSRISWARKLHRPCRTHRAPQRRRRVGR